MQPNDHSWLFRLTCRVLKYFFLFLVGVAVAYLIAAIVGSFHIAEPTLPTVIELIGRLGLAVVGLTVTTIIFESLRH